MNPKADQPIITDSYWKHSFPLRNQGHSGVFPFVSFCGSDSFLFTLLLNTFWVLGSVGASIPQLTLQRWAQSLSPDFPGCHSTIRGSKQRWGCCISRACWVPAPTQGFAYKSSCAHKRIKNIYLIFLVCLWQKGCQAIYTTIIDRDECSLLIFTVSLAECVAHYQHPINI